MIKTINKNKILLFMIFIILILNISACKKLDNPYKSSRLIDNLYTANNDMYAEGVAKKIIVPDITENKKVDNVGAGNYFLASLDYKNAPLAKYFNPYEKVSIASLTKLMTALVVLENCNNLNEEYYVTTDAIDIPKDASKCNLRAGDKVTAKDLLYGLLIPSGNDAANCLAENLVDNYDNFIIMMNNEAERLGALNTHFANPHGLDSEYHFSTAYDMFLITRELSKYDLFNEITKCKEYKANIKQSDDTIRTETWKTTNLFITQELMISGNVEFLAGKTGNTSNAGDCLILYIRDKKNNQKYISVVLNAKSKRHSYYNSNALFGEIK